MLPIASNDTCYLPIESYNSLCGVREIVAEQAKIKVTMEYILNHAPTHLTHTTAQYWPNYITHHFPGDYNPGTRPENLTPHTILLYEV